MSSGVGFGGDEAPVEEKSPNADLPGQRGPPPQAQKQAVAGVAS
jgi:hypothetical protein